MKYLIILLLLAGCATTQPTEHLRWSDKGTAITLDLRVYGAHLIDNTMVLVVDGNEQIRQADWCDREYQAHKLIASATRGWDVQVTMGRDKILRMQVNGVPVITRPAWCVEIVKYVD